MTAKRETMKTYKITLKMETIANGYKSYDSGFYEPARNAEEARKKAEKLAAWATNRGDGYRATISKIEEA